MEGIANWSTLTWQQKREERFKKWLDAPGVKFDSPAAQKAYKERVTRFIKAIKLEKPDRVPVMLPAGYFPAVYAGYDLKTVMYDYDKLAEAWRKFNKDFQPDSHMGPGTVYPGRVIDMLGHKLHKWPGHGLPDNAPMYQFVEGVYMKPEEYNDFMENPTEYWLRVFLPRTATAMEPLKDLASFNPVLTNPLGFIMSLANPDIQKSFTTLVEAGKEIQGWLKATGSVSREALAAGHPSFGGGMAGAPFDNLSDVLRGTTGIVMDMYRQPGKIKEAMERLVPIIVKGAVRSANAALSPVISMPLHKGENSFMSQKAFEEFYWPTFKKVLLGLVDEGLVPMPFAEGNYEPRLDVIKDMPKSSIVWYFEVMDMAKAKEKLGGVACIAGNVPASLIVTSTPTMVKAACLKLIETCGRDGGYILSGAAGISKCDPANLHAMIAASKEAASAKG
jgi:uroporphyrinogen-III decarboxylase